MTFEDLKIQTVPGKTRYYTICPECNEKRQHHRGAKCLTVNDEPGNRWYKCHHCNFSGNLDIMDKYNKVLEKSKMPKQSAKMFTKEVREYLAKRGIDEKVALREGLYEYTAHGKPVLAFPAYMNKTLVNVKYLNIRWNAEEGGLKWWQMSKEYGTSSIFVGMQTITFERKEVMQSKKFIIITEGEIDMLTWKQCGYNNAVSVPQGAPNPKAKEFKDEFKYVEEPYVKSFFHPDNVDLIIFSTDDDEPGRLLRNHLALFFGKERCRYINYPAKYKDINEVYAGNEKKGLPALGKKGVDECFQNLSSFPVKGVIRPFDVQEELNTIADRGFTAGFGCGVKEIDELFTLKPKHITFVTGAPGCFAADQLIHTSRGVIPISEVKKNDTVLSYNQSKDLNEYRYVLKTFRHKNHPGKLLKITLRDGTIIKVTENHEFFTGTSYMQIKELLLSLGKIKNDSNGKMGKS